MMIQPQPFPLVQSKLDLDGAQYQQNVDSWKGVLEKFETLLDGVCKEGDEQSVTRHRERGQLLGKVSTVSRSLGSGTESRSARDRVALLLDPDSPFLELGAFSGFGNESSSPCASLIAGIGSVKSGFPNWFDGSA